MIKSYFSILIVPKIVTIVSTAIPNSYSTYPSFIPWKVPFPNNYPKIPDKAANSSQKESFLLCSFSLINVRDFLYSVFKISFI